MDRFSTPALATALACSLTSPLGACSPALEKWTCNDDAEVSRPLADPATVADEAGALPAGECAATCGPPVSKCRRTTVDGGEPGAICPVCTF